MYELELFAGAGGGILGGLLCGHTCVGACEIEEYPRKVLLARQRDGIFPRFPIWDDIKTFSQSNKQCREYFKYLKSIRKNLVVKGGFPCQDISSAGSKKGICGERSSLWNQMSRVICEIRPEYALVENSPNLAFLGLNRVLCDFAKMGYNARWCVLGSSDSGGCHKRKRMWIFAYSASIRQQRSWRYDKPISSKKNQDRETDWFKSILQGKSMPYMCGENHGMDNGMDRLKAIGNGQDPRVVKLAWDILTEGII